MLHWCRDVAFFICHTLIMRYPSYVDIEKKSFSSAACTQVFLIITELQNSWTHWHSGMRSNTHKKKPNSSSIENENKLNRWCRHLIIDRWNGLGRGGKKRNWNLIQNRYSTERALNMLQMKRIGSQLQSAFSIKSRCIFNDFSWFLALTLSLAWSLCNVWWWWSRLEIENSWKLHSLSVLFGDAIRLPTDSLHHHPQNRQQPTSESRNISNFYCSSPPSFGPVYLLFVFLAQFILPIVSHLSLFSHSIQEPNNPQFQCTTNSISRLNFL